MTQHRHSYDLNQLASCLLKLTPSHLEVSAMITKKQKANDKYILKDSSISVPLILSSVQAVLHEEALYFLRVKVTHISLQNRALAEVSQCPHSLLDTMCSLLM